LNLPSSSSLRSTLAFAAIAAATSGCSIQYSPDLLDAPTNKCASSDECGSNAACVGGRCLGTNVDLADLIVEVRPNSGASYGASRSFILPVNTSFAALKNAPFDVVHDITLPQLQSISAGLVHVDYDYAPTCKNLGLHKSVPATITFDRLTDLAGFHFNSYTVTAAKKTETSEDYEFDASLLAGKYSVYIQPLPIDGCDDAPPPPVFYASQEFSPSIDGKGSMADWAVITPTTLEGDIQIPDGGDLTGWRLDILEPSGGRVISTTQTLQQGMIAFTVNVKLSFVWNDKTVSPYIRLRPPEGEARPSVYWGLIESLSLQSTTQVHLSVANLQIEPREVEIRVQDAHDNGVPSSVQIQSVMLQGGPVATNAAYTIDIPQTDAQGFFKLKLPLGTYQFRATPLDDSNFAVGDLRLEIDAIDAKVPGNPCFCGRVLEVAPKSPVTGTVFTPTGLSLPGASITMSPSQPDAVNYWKRVVHAIDPRPLAPRGEISVTDETGQFAFHVDPGPSDLTVRPLSMSGFPWLVRPRVQVGADSGAQFGDLTLPNTAVLRGKVTDPSGAPARNVVVDGWRPVQNEGGAAPTTVIQIGSTTTDENGEYTLLLPASISQ
jgi:hypothetical protein